MFKAGARPDARAIQALAVREGQFSVSIEPGEGTLEQEHCWVELLASGLTFDLAGLAPGNAFAVQKMQHVFGLPPKFDPSGLEAVVLTPGPHLRGGGTMLPVVRCLAWLAAQLASLEGVQAIVWHPAQSCNAPGYFREGVLRWIEGGAFPGLGLTALTPMQDGSLLSVGLALFTGQELRLAPDLFRDRSEGAKMAVRLLHWLVENGRVTETLPLTGPSGETLMLEPERDQGIVTVWKGSR